MLVDVLFSFRYPSSFAALLRGDVNNKNPPAMAITRVSDAAARCYRRRHTKREKKALAQTALNSILLLVLRCSC